MPSCFWHHFLIFVFIVIHFTFTYIINHTLPCYDFCLSSTLCFKKIFKIRKKSHIFTCMVTISSVFLLLFCVDSDFSLESFFIFLTLTGDEILPVPEEGSRGGKINNSRCTYTNQVWFQRYWPSEMWS